MKLLAVAAIGWYQRTVSPRKGFVCAHRTYRGGLSCSEWIKRAIARRGLRIGILLARRRFALCKKTHNEKKVKKNEAAPANNSCDISYIPFDCCCVGADIGTAVGSADCAACACIPFV